MAIERKLVRRTVIFGNACGRRVERGDDVYETPPEAIEALIGAERLSGRSWDPCLGPEDRIGGVLRARGHSIVTSGLLTGIDFFQQERAPDGVDTNFTNPPYLRAADSVRHGLTLVPTMMLLLRLSFLESARRSDIIDGGRLARRGRFRESDLLRKLSETVVARCMKEGIVGGEAFAVDASMIVADAYRRRGVARVEDLDPTSSRAVAEYLSVLDDAAFGAATPTEPKSISPTDPAARYTAAADTPAVYAYSDNYLVDLKNAVIMDGEATTAIRQAEVGAAKTMLDRTAEKSMSPHPAWSPTQAMAPPRCSDGWSTSAGSSRT